MMCVCVCECLLLLCVIQKHSSLLFIDRCIHSVSHSVSHFIQLFIFIFLWHQKAFFYSFENTCALCAMCVCVCSPPPLPLPPFTLDVCCALFAFVPLFRLVRFSCYLLNAVCVYLNMRSCACVCEHWHTGVVTTVCALLLLLFHFVAFINLFWSGRVIVHCSDDYKPYVCKLMKWCSHTHTRAHTLFTHTGGFANI